MSTYLIAALALSIYSAVAATIALVTTTYYRREQRNLQEIRKRIEVTDPLRPDQR